MAATATINDVAKMAGVSIKTVSRVVNREPNVREQTREIVQQAIEALNYRPSLAARGLAGGRSFLIGLIYDNASDSFLLDLQHGILAACQERHYGLALCPAISAKSDMVEEVIRWVEATQPDGIILTPPLSDSRDLALALIDKGVPFVSVSSSGTGLGPAVFIDEFAAAKEMTAHLIDAGHTHIAFVKGPADHTCSELRLQGFCKALEEAGVAFDTALVGEGQFSFESGVAAAERLLQRSEPPTAIFASNDDMAAGVMRVALQKGLRIPDDLAVAGFDDSKMSSQVWPGLSTVRQPIEEIGRLASERLMTAISNSKNNGGQGAATAGRNDDEVLPFELRLRASTGARG